MEHVKRMARFVVTAGRTCRYLWACRAAIPWPIKAMLGLAMALKCLPLDFLADETLTALAVLALNRYRPGLMKACYRAAQLQA